MKILLILTILVGFSCKENPILFNKEYEISIRNAREIVNGEKSLQFSIKALSISKKLNDSVKIAHSCFEISNDYIKIGNLDKSLLFINRSLNIYKSKNMYNEIGMCYNQISRIYNKKNDVKNAISYITYSIDIHKKLCSYNLLAEDYNNLGEIYRLNNNHYLSLLNLKMADSIFSVYNDTINRICSLQNIALVFSSIGVPDSSDKYILKSEEMLRKQIETKSSNEIRRLKYIDKLKTDIVSILIMSMIVIVILLLSIFKLNKNLINSNNSLSAQKDILEKNNIVIKSSLQEKEILLKQINHLNNLVIKDSLFIKKEDIFHKVKIKDILFIKSEGNYLEVYVNSNFKYIIRCTIKSFLDYVAKYSFFQTHKSYVVNLEHIDSVSNKFVKVKQFEVPLSQSKKEELIPLISSFT